MTKEVSDSNIYPTHSCFDDALENLIYLMKRDGREMVMRGELLIAHAIIAPDGEDIAHAWLERGGKTVYFAGIIDGEKVLVECDLASYYENSVVKHVTKYTLFQAYAEEKRWVVGISCIGHGDNYCGARLLHGCSLCEKRIQTNSF